MGPARPTNLQKRLARLPGTTHHIAHYAVDTAGGVVDDRPHLAEIDAAFVVEDSLVNARVHDFADKALLASPLCVEPQQAIVEIRLPSAEVADEHVGIKQDSHTFHEQSLPRVFDSRRAAPLRAG